jgi:hypothetical protein
MGIAGGNRVASIIESAISKKGGRIIDSFIIKTGGIKDREIIKKGEEIGLKYNY